MFSKKKEMLKQRSTEPRRSLSLEEKFRDRGKGSNARRSVWDGGAKGLRTLPAARSERAIEKKSRHGGGGLEVDEGDGLGGVGIGII